MVNRATTIRPLDAKNDVVVVEPATEAIGTAGVSSGVSRMDGRCNSFSGLCCSGRESEWIPPASAGELERHLYEVSGTLERGIGEGGRSTLDDHRARVQLSGEVS